MSTFFFYCLTVFNERSLKPLEQTMSKVDTIKSSHDRLVATAIDSENVKSNGFFFQRQHEDSVSHAAELVSDG